MPRVWESTKIAQSYPLKLVQLSLQAKGSQYHECDKNNQHPPVGKPQSMIPCKRPSLIT